jgi:hypothetical protein
MILKDNEFFFYKERTFPNLNNPFGWSFAISSNNIKKSEDVPSRIVGNIETLAEHICNEGHKKVVLISNSFYRGDFTLEGSHGEEYLHQEKGVSKKNVKNFCNVLKKMNIHADYMDCSISLRYIID